MKSRLVGLLVIIVIIGAGLTISKVLGSQKENLERKHGDGAKSQISIVEVHNEYVERHFHTSGRLRAVDRIDLYAEVSGVVKTTSRNFKAGNRFSKGDTLLELDDTVYRNSVRAQKSQLINLLAALIPDLRLDYPQAVDKWENTLYQIHPDQPLPDLPQTDSEQERLFISTRNIYSTWYTVLSMDATLDKYTLRAPFDGVLTRSQINPGALVRNGQKLGEFLNPDIFELEATVNHQVAGQLTLGQEVNLFKTGDTDPVRAKIVRINDSVDPETQTVRIYIQARSPRLQDGLYLSAVISSRSDEPLAAVDRDLLVDGKALYVVKNHALRLQEVTPVEENLDQVYVRGLADGTRILGKMFAHVEDGFPLPQQNSGSHD